MLHHPKGLGTLPSIASAPVHISAQGPVCLMTRIDSMSLIIYYSAGFLERFAGLENGYQVHPQDGRCRALRHSSASPHLVLLVARPRSLAPLKGVGNANLQVPRILGIWKARHGS